MFDYCGSELVLSTCNEPDNSPRNIRSQLAISESVSFRIRATKEKYIFEFHTGSGSKWKVMGSIGALEMTACDFTGTIFGVFACGKNESDGASVSIKDFDVV